MSNQATAVSAIVSILAVGTGIFMSSLKHLSVPAMILGAVVLLALIGGLVVTALA
jgi:putative effector of murein hydrolase LrgA (UPF0299 family)